MANWFKKEKIKEHLQMPSLPAGFDIFQTNRGEWTVVGPPTQPQQFDEERPQIVRIENLDDMDTEQAIKYVTRKALQRIPLLM